MRVPERHKAILELAQKTDLLKVDDVSEELNVSRETVRRDFVYLDSRGLLRRIHGGARAIVQATAERSFTDRRSLHADAKKIIGHLAAQQIEDGETLMIDTGSTTVEFVTALPSHLNLTIITNSFEIASLLSVDDARRDIYVLGGKYRHETQQTLGTFCLDQLDRFRADHAIIGVGAISSSGDLMDYDPQEAQLARGMIARSQKTTILANKSKFDTFALTRFSTIEEVDCIVTDEIPNAKIQRIAEIGNVSIIFPET